MKRKGQWMLVFAALLLMFGGLNVAAAEDIYGHISFVDNEAAVLHADGSESRALVNLPVAPGDTVVTRTGRCELQFDNGTVIRLDKNSRLQVTTVQAPSLTSRWKVTTLHLLQGQVYSLPQTYNLEVFQIITPNAAVKLKSRTKATVRFDADLGTSLFSDAGKFEVLYGADNRSPKKIKVKSGRALAVGADNTLADRVEKRSLEFVAWNEYIDRHFKDLHFGISKVPPKLKFGSAALTYWAEKWSSLVGEWVYDDIFGYVWKPAAEQFANTARPFFNAEYVRINGQLFLVPQEAWGWVPAHMGTWVWLSRGWTWIPGDAFHSGVVEYQGRCFFPTFDYFFYRQYGLLVWRHEDWLRNSQEVWRQIREANLQPNYDVPPPFLRPFIKKINKLPVNAETNRLGLERNLSVIETEKLPLVRGTKLPDPVPDLAPKAGPISHLEMRNETRRAGDKGTARDWNPDAYWARRSGLSIRYSSPTNSVVCPELKISSESMTGMERVRLNWAATHHPGYSPTEGMQGQSAGNPAPAPATEAAPPQSNAGQTEKKDDKGK